MQRRAVVGELGRLAGAALVLVGAQRAHPRARVRAAARAGPQRVQDPRHAAVELRRDRARVLVDRLGAVDRDDLGLLAERLPEAEAEVHRHADDERDVGALERGRARARERERVVGGDAAAGEAVEEHRDPALLGERLERLLAVRPVQVRPGHDHRALGLAQQRDRAGEVVAVRLRAGGRVGQRRARLGLVGLGEDEVEREVDERRAGVGLQRHGQRLVDEPRDLGRRLGRRGELRHRADERDVVDLLQRPLAPAPRRRAAAEDEHRRVALLRAGQRAHRVGDARARR